MRAARTLDVVNVEEKANSSAACLVCGGRKLYYDFSLGKYRVEECADCGLMRLNPQPTDAELAAIYGPNYFAFSDDPDGQLHASELKSQTADHYLDLLESYTKAPLTGHLLEVGCGHGDFLSRAVARGLSVTGVEYSPHAVQIAATKLGTHGQVLCGEVGQLLAVGARFDFIMFSDVLEHVRDPRAFLRSVRALLRENGIAIAIVPSLDSVSARLMKSKWVEFKPEHLWYFSTKTLTQLLHSENFGMLKAEPARKVLSFDYIAQHFDRYPVPPFSTVVDLLRRLLPNVLRRRPIRVTASGIVMFSRRQEIRVVKTLSVVMPAYNEVNSIRGAIERVLAKNIEGVAIELIIVESGSIDGTREIVREYEGQERVNVIWQDQPRGKGNAVRAGLENINGDYVLIQDADDEYDIEDYDALLEPLITGEAAFVLGARHGGGAWKMRQFDDQRLTGHLLNFGHWFFTTLVNVVYGLRLRDPFTMYKVFRADCLRGLRFECNRFDFDYELVIKLVRSGYRPIEIPVNYRSRSFKQGKKVDAFRDPWTWLRAIVKFRLQKL
ncbi:MAG: glycosyltransferase [Gammaproteobacteria bacterium]|nr:glycosyltransferase [Gammaproteobacteria bacterium]